MDEEEEDESVVVAAGAADVADTIIVNVKVDDPLTDVDVMVDVVNGVVEDVMMVALKWVSRGESKEGGVVIDVVGD